MKQIKSFLVPPDLQNKLLIFGLTIPEFAIIVVSLFIAVTRLLSGQFNLLILPTAFIILFVRTLDGNVNVYSILKKRFSFCLLSQVYSIKGSDVIVNKKARND